MWNCPKKYVRSTRVEGKEKFSTVFFNGRETLESGIDCWSMAARGQKGGNPDVPLHALSLTLTLTLIFQDQRSYRLL